ncbi:CpeT/CpcT family [Ferrimonas sediminum]|uniref:CpeT/CpcT family n=1 Tax=Ferrimonas sediminum TaxID=718193 RepID=A0A1G8Y4T7_9GAMM|nr:chromophore lyase CpcT/CpeT [Ferrimonas sediminum]SDJ97165.1 CpeT/CpcT family [Ferrimonas sediminum]
MKPLVSLLLMLPLTATAQSPGDLPTLSLWLQGNFSSEQQSQQLENYFHLQLHTVPVWTASSSGPWLYMEQASFKRPERPYRQRLLHLQQTAPGQFTYTPYTLNQPQQYMQAWRYPARLAPLTPDQITVRNGCEVYLHWQAEQQRYHGQTRVGTCASKMYGASYTTIEISVYQDRIVKWARGYDADHNFIWGGSQGGYRFDRLSQ